MEGKRKRGVVEGDGEGIVEGKKKREDYKQLRSRIHKKRRKEY